MYMGIAVGLLSQQSGHTYPVTIHAAVAGREVNGALAKLTWVLIVVWFLLLLGCTFAFFKPTFSNSLNDYVAARLLVEHPVLVDGRCCGSLEGNAELRARFSTVGDSKVQEIVGHITPGGEGVLNKNRKYAATNSRNGGAPEDTQFTKVRQTVDIDSYR
jgi:hypothetical protein